MIKKFTIHIKLLTVVLLTVLSSETKAAFTYGYTRINSEASDATGIYVRFSIPSNPRYTCGAPIVIYMNGGWGASGMLGSMFTMANYGFIVVEFNYPGGGSGAQKSGGVFDNRGPNCMKAAKDVIRFALGQTTDKYDKFLGHSTGSVVPLYDNLGIIGGSNGGCNLLAVLGLYTSQLSQVKWVSFFESPIGNEMLTADPGKPYGSVVSINRNYAYNDSTGIYNWALLRYARDTSVFISGNTSIKGLFYFDMNGNNLFNRGVDYDLVGKYDAATPGATKKLYYSVPVIEKGIEYGIYPPPSPMVYHANLLETKNYWYIISSEHFIDSFMNEIPDLKVLFMVRDIDHITSAPDHPEVIIAWNKFSNNGCSWFRVNSDKSYIEYITGTSLPLAPDNNANIAVDHMNIRNMIMPGNIFTNRYFNHYASTLEMADRVMNSDWSYNLPGVLNKICPEARTENVSSTVTENVLYPNPAASETYIQVNASDFGQSTLTVYNSLGQQMIPTQIDEITKGFNLLILDINNLSAGNYFVRIDAPGMNRTLQFTRE